MQKICPVHKQQMRRTKTRYGFLWHCPSKGCDVASWDGDTCTPADQRTRDARQDAHAAFDRLWNSGKERTACYRRLAVHLGVPNKECHIGMFDFDQCQRVIEFAQTASR